MVSVRKASLKDLKAVQELNLELFRREKLRFDPFLDLSWSFGRKGKKYFLERIKGRNSIVLVAEDGKNAILGYLAGSLINCEEFRLQAVTAELENMLVAPQSRGKGVGRLLVKAFLEWCESRKAERVKVCTAAGNSEAHAFYKRHGFEEYDLILEKRF